MTELATTSPTQKLATSAVNLAIILIVTLPIALCLRLSFYQARIAFMIVAATYLVVALFDRSRRSLGMMILGIHWREKYSLSQISLYGVLYLLSFSTLLFWIYFPFDLFLANIILIQLPSVLITGTTVHGFCSGRVTTVKSNRKKM